MRSSLMLFVLLLPISSFGLPFKVFVEGVSSSGRSIIIDRGTIHGLKVGQKGSFTLQEGSLEIPRLRFLGRGELVKLSGNKSYWYLALENDYKLKEGVRVSLELDNQLLKGKRDISVREYRKTYGSSISLAEVEYEETHGVPKNLHTHEGEYFSEKVSKKNKQDTDKDLTVKKRRRIRAGQEVTLGNGDRVKTARVEDFGDKEDISFVREFVDENSAKNLVTNKVSKTNSLEKGLGQLYSDSQAFKVESDKSFNNAFFEYKQNKKNKEKLNPKFIQKVKKEGSNWSAGFDDQELRNYMIKTGAASEKLRRERVLGKKLSHEVDLIVSTSLFNQTNPDDPNHQNNGYSLALSYEYFLAHSIPAIESWSFELGLERGIENIDLGGINGRVSYGTFFGGVNWYPYNPPTSLNKLIFYVGGGIKRGNGDMTSISLSKDYGVQVLTLPSLYVGAKYRFDDPTDYEVDSPVGFGINARLLSDLNQWTVLDTLEDSINSTTTLNDIKFNVSLSIFF